MQDPIVWIYIGGMPGFDPFIELDGEQFRLMSYVSEPVMESRPSVSDALRIVALAEDLHGTLNRYFRFVDEGDRRLRMEEWRHAVSSDWLWNCCFHSGWRDLYWGQRWRDDFQ